MKNEEVIKSIEFYEFVYREAFDRVENVDVACEIIMQVGKDRRMKIAQEERQQHKQERIDEATEKQIALLRRMGVKIPEKLSKVEASKLIDENIK
jgi:hypothetical protein